MEHETLINAVIVILIFLAAFSFNLALVIGIHELEDRKRKKK